VFAWPAGLGDTAIGVTYAIYLNCRDVQYP
jgi:hypothetical protein